MPGKKKSLWVSPEARLEYLADGRLKGEGTGSEVAYIDVLNQLYTRSTALCDIVAEAGLSASESEESEVSGESLATVMGILNEDIQVAKILTNRLYELPPESAQQ